MHLPNWTNTSGHKQSIREESRRTQNPIEKTNKKLTFTTTCNPKNPDIFQAIKSNMPILQSDEKMRTSLQDNQIKKSHKQTKKLKQLLTKAKFEEQEQNNEPTVSKCGRSN